MREHPCLCCHRPMTAQNGDTAHGPLRECSVSKMLGNQQDSIHSGIKCYAAKANTCAYGSTHLEAHTPNSFLVCGYEQHDPCATKKSSRITHPPHWHIHCPPPIRSPMNHSHFRIRTQNHQMRQHVKPTGDVGSADCKAMASAQLSRGLH